MTKTEREAYLVQCRAAREARRERNRAEFRRERAEREAAELRAIAEGRERYRREYLAGQALQAEIDARGDLVTLQ